MPLVRCPSPRRGVTLRMHMESSPNAPAMEGGGCFRRGDLTVSSGAATLPHFTCRYHPQPGTTYKFSAHSLVPQGMCLDAFHAIYPRALAMLYDARFESSGDLDGVEACCPNPHTRVTFEIRRVQRLGRR
jgi:uncharacterized repeat protein (TIGR04076 family)